MTKYQILFAPTAQKQLFKLPKSIQIRLLNAIARLSDDPFYGKNLKGELSDCYSLRVGDYRVIYSVSQKQLQVEIIRVAHRREVYR